MENFQIVSSGSLVEALRDSGYKSATSATSELCDNAFQANAGSFHVFIEEKSRKPDAQLKKRGRPLAPGIKRVVFVDDGDGMSKTELRHSVRFGFSSHFNDRTGMGRFGMGLPNASFSQARNLKVYSKQESDDWHFVSLDLNKIISEEMKEVPIPEKKLPPDKYLELIPGVSGTIIIWEECDRIDEKTPARLQSNMITEMSRVYRYFLTAGRSISINGKKVDPFDPLYLMPEARYSGASQWGDEIPLEFKLHNGDKAVATLRFSLTPMEWQVSEAGNNIPADSDINKERRVFHNNGISFVRADREIDFVYPRGLVGYHTSYKRWWSAEVSFSAELDEVFGIEFTKQRVVLNSIAREKLTEHFRGNANSLQKRIMDRAKKSGKVPPYSKAEEIASRIGSRFKPSIPSKDDKKRSAEETEKINLQVAEERKQDSETVEQSLARVVNELPIVIRYEDRPGAPFYRVEVIGLRTDVIINKTHSFYRKVLQELEKVSGDALTGVQLLLFAIGKTEAYSGDALRDWYEDQRLHWSGNLTSFLREFKPTEEDDEDID